MSRAKVKEHAINALIGLLASMFLLFGTGAWNLKENTSDHHADVLQIKAQADADRLQLNSKLDRILDALCDAAQHRQPRTCSGGEVRQP